MQPLIKWSGAKRYLNKTITTIIPKNTERYVDVFCGGCSSIPHIYQHGISRFVCNDINTSLISIYKLFQSNPDVILSGYEKRWNKLNKLGEGYYYEIRDRYNQYKSPIDFFFLTRTCYNGLIRYNRDGNYNVSFHHNRKGIYPDRIKKIYSEWEHVLKNVLFSCGDYYNSLELIDTNDFVFLDPPYSESDGMYGIYEFDYSKLWQFIDKLNQMNVQWALTLDSNRVVGVQVPHDLYRSQILGSQTDSKFRVLHGMKDVKIREMFYSNMRLDNNIL